MASSHHPVQDLLLEIQLAFVELALGQEQLAIPLALDHVLQQSRDRCVVKCDHGLEQRRALDLLELGLLRVRHSPFQQTGNLRPCFGPLRTYVDSFC